MKTNACILIVSLLMFLCNICICSCVKQTKPSSKLIAEETKTQSNEEISKTKEQLEQEKFEIVIEKAKTDALNAEPWNPIFEQDKLIYDDFTLIDSLTGTVFQLFKSIYSLEYFDYRSQVEVLDEIPQRLQLETQKGGLSVKWRYSDGAICSMSTTNAQFQTPRHVKVGDSVLDIYKAYGVKGGIFCLIFDDINATYTPLDNVRSDNLDKKRRYVSFVENQGYINEGRVSYLMGDVEKEVIIEIIFSIKEYKIKSIEILFGD